MFLRFLCKLILYIFGWQTYIDTDILNRLRCSPRLVLVYPHTTRWDFLFMLLYMFQHPDITRRVKFLINESLYNTPLIHYVFKYLGGIPAPSIHNRHSAGTTLDIAQKLDVYKSYIFVISPKGTCEKREWKSGYYYIGKESKSGFIAAGFNYATHRPEAGSVLNDKYDIREVRESLLSSLQYITPLKNPSFHKFLLQISLVLKFIQEHENDRSHSERSSITTGIFCR